MSLLLLLKSGSAPSTTTATATVYHLVLGRTHVGMRSRGLRIKPTHVVK